MAENRNFVLPGQPPGTSSSRPVASASGFGFSGASRGEFGGFLRRFRSDALLLFFWKKNPPHRTLLCRSRTSRLKCLRLEKAVRCGSLSSCENFTPPFSFPRFSSGFAILLFFRRVEIELNQNLHGRQFFWFPKESDWPVPGVFP